MQQKRDNDLRGGEKGWIYTLPHQDKFQMDQNLNIKE